MTPTHRTSILDDRIPTQKALKPKRDISAGSSYVPTGLMDLMIKEQMTNPRLKTTAKRRITAVLRDGRPRTVDDIGKALGEDGYEGMDPIRRALKAMLRDGLVKSTKACDMTQIWEKA